MIQNCEDFLEKGFHSNKIYINTIGSREGVVPPPPTPNSRRPMIFYVPNAQFLFVACAVQLNLVDPNTVYPNYSVFCPVPFFILLF